MQIVCPHCSTSYEIAANTIGPQGRQVRCARCKEVWHAVPEPAAAHAAAMAPSEELPDATAEDWNAAADEADWQAADSADPPHVESPSIATDHATAQDWGDAGDPLSDPPEPAPRRPSRAFGRRGTSSLRVPEWLALPQGLRFGLMPVIAAMGALALGLVVWRTEVVRVMPQTAAFFKGIGFPVNLRGLDFTDLRISTETVDGAPVMIVEGGVVGLTRKPVEIPRLRFVLRDANANDIHAWNAVLEQPVVNPGEKVAFRTRLAAPPAEAREIAIRFFNRRDIGGGV